MVGNSIQSYCNLSLCNYQNSSLRWIQCATHLHGRKITLSEMVTALLISNIFLNTFKHNKILCSGWAYQKLDWYSLGPPRTQHGNVNAISSFRFMC